MRMEWVKSHTHIFEYIQHTVSTNKYKTYIHNDIKDNEIPLTACPRKVYAVLLSAVDRPGVMGDGPGT